MNIPKQSGNLVINHGLELSDVDHRFTHLLGCVHPSTEFRATKSVSGEVNVEFPDASPLGKLSVVTGPEWGKVAKINLVNLTKAPQPVDYMILPNRILISWSRPGGPADIRDATVGELHEAIRQALVSWLVPANLAA